MDFRWPEWTSTEEGRRLLTSAEAIKSATAEQLEKLITVIVRRDRFCEGSLLGDFNDGMLLLIVERAESLLREICTS